VNVAEEKIASLFRGAIELPALSPIITQLLGVLENPESSARDVELILSKDPSMSAKMLRLANSAYYGRSGQVSRISTAAVVLGFNTIKSLALSASVIQSLQGVGTSTIDPDRFWGHSLGCAIAARMLAEGRAELDGEEAFAGGLLHDLGKLLLGQHAQEETRECLRELKRARRPLFEIEERILGVSHADIGGWLVRKWGLPEAICTPVEEHHHPPEAGAHAGMIRLVAMADSLSKLSGNSVEETGEAVDSDKERLIGYGIPEERIEELAWKVRADIQEVRMVMGI